MSGFVYLWFDKKHRRFYVGSHWGPQDDGYICSSRWMRLSYHRRPADFKRRILATVSTNRADLFEEEARWLAMIKPHEIKVRYYNLKCTWGQPWHAEDDTRLTVGQKISKALKGKKRGKYSPDRVAKTAAAIRATYEKRREETGQAISDDLRKRIGDGRRGKPHTKTHRRYMKSAMREARAANPKWDKKHALVCVTCGRKFKGRETQRHCSAACRANGWYRTRKSPTRPEVTVR